MLIPSMYLTFANRLAFSVISFDSYCKNLGFHEDFLWLGHCVNQHVVNPLISITMKWNLSNIFKPHLHPSLSPLFFVNSADLSGVLSLAISLATA